MAEEMEDNPSNFEGLQLLRKADLENAEKFLHQLINSLCKQKGPLFKNFNSIWNIKEWIMVSDSWLAKIRSWVGDTIGKDEIRNQLLKEDFPDDWISRILICITLRKNDIKQSLTNQTTNIAQSSMKNFDWKVKMVMSSDKLASIREPLANVDFELDTEDGRKTVALEMSKGELKMLIDKLEAANKVVVQLRS
eukprot:Seg2995.4 transcript_id=Seg2995.4/GoldUCD/mRNA.D3Y31 product="COMM domain-containing protein 8" protein_id=Seg2995.4/GoldUCD/D3Y31